ncbi:kinase-like domain-containing protein, partial [Tanacetum coccineum]
STGVKGTIGYAPPEYGIGSEMTSSGDVYSFGILLLEVMTGKKPTDDMFNDGLSLHKFAYMALLAHVIDVIDNDAIMLQNGCKESGRMFGCNYEDWNFMLCGFPTTTDENGNCCE